MNIKRPEGNNKIIRGFEMRVFRYGLILAVVFRFARCVHEYLIDSPPLILQLGIFNLLVGLFLVRLSQANHRLAFVIFHTVTLITAIITWKNSGGWNGTTPYLFIVLTIFIVMTSSKLIMGITFLAYGFVLFIFLQNFPFLESFSEPNVRYSVISMHFDFFVSTILLILITVYLKARFLRYREYIALTNKKLISSTDTLREHTDQLRVQKAELTAIRNNLQTMISAKIKEKKYKAEVLEEYAFVNAHHVRGPLARILGLIYLIEQESPDQNVSNAIVTIKNEAREMDDIIRKINHIIS